MGKQHENGEPERDSADPEWDSILRIVCWITVIAVPLLIVAAVILVLAPTE